MGTVRDGNCPGWELPGMGTVRDGNCPGWELSGMGTVRDGNCPGWELSTWWELSGMGTVRDGNCPGILVRGLNISLCIVIHIYLPVIDIHIYMEHKVDNITDVIRFNNGMQVFRKENNIY